MNFYKHHIGDYASASEHLTWDEDMAYSRLLRVYYRDERPLPADVSKVQRLVRAQTAAQKAAVEVVLTEFFVPEADGWHNKRADAEIAQASNQAATNRRIAEHRETTKRSRVVHEPSNDSSTKGSPGYMGEREPIQTPDSRLSKDSEGETPSAGAALPANPRKALWDLAVSLMGKDCRPIVGAAIKRVGEPRVGEVLGKMAAKPPADPKTWFIKATQERGVVC